MQDHVYKMIELAGSSETSIEDAIQNAVARAAKTLHDLRWFQVVETRGQARFTQEAIPEGLVRRQVRRQQGGDEQERRAAGRQIHGDPESRDRGGLDAEDPFHAHRSANSVRFTPI